MMASLSEILRLEIEHQRTKMQPPYRLWFSDYCIGTLYAGSILITRAYAGTEKALREFIADDMLEAISVIDKNAKQRFMGMEIKEELWRFRLEQATSKEQISELREMVSTLENGMPLACMIVGFLSFIAGCFIGRI